MQERCYSSALAMEWHLVLSLRYVFIQSFALYGPTNYLLIAWHSRPVISVTHYSAPTGPMNYCQYYAVDLSYRPPTILLNCQIFVYFSLFFFHANADLTWLHTCMPHCYYYCSFHCSMSMSHCRTPEKNFSELSHNAESVMTDVDSVIWRVLWLMLIP